MKMTKKHAREIARGLKGNDEYVLTILIEPPEYNTYLTFVNTGQQQVSDRLKNRIESDKIPCFQLKSGRIREHSHYKDTIGFLTEIVYLWTNKVLYEFSTQLDEKVDEKMKEKEKDIERVREALNK